MVFVCFASISNVLGKVKTNDANFFFKVIMKLPLNETIPINYVILLPWPERQKPPNQAFFLKLFWCYWPSPAEPWGGLRWKSQMERTRAHNKDKFDSLPWYRYIHREIANTGIPCIVKSTKHTWCYNDTDSLGGLHGDPSRPRTESIRLDAAALIYV